MVFMCQRDSFLTEFDTRVLSCDEVNDKIELDAVGVQVPNDAAIYKVILEDTIIFPEGGGQPDDRGLVAGRNVVRSIRKGSQAIHYIPLSTAAKVETNSTNLFQPGETVTTSIDWKRRFDHMQQHSGQHLITATADKLFGFPTTSWWLGSDESNIELDTKEITPEQIGAIEEAVNLSIRQALPVSVDVVELDDPKLKQARGRNLPEDVKGDIRIVTMEGVESNVCCGTHVTNLSQLQAIKLLHVVKKKGKCLLHFLCGNRVLERFSQQFQREQALMGILKTGPNEFSGAAEKLNSALKNARKSCLVLSKDLAALEAKTLKELEIPPRFWSYHRDNVDLEFANALLRELGTPENTILMVTIKVEGSQGHMFIVGKSLSSEQLTNLGDTLCGTLDGKGVVVRGCYQAKVNKMNANSIKKAISLAQDAVESLDGNKLES